MLNKKKSILILGALPPPIHGASIYYQDLINNKLLHNMFNIYFINLNLRNVLSSYQKFSFSKIIMTFFFLFKFILLLTSKNIDLIYSGVAYPKYPFIKDSLFVIFAKIFKKKIIGCILGTGLKSSYKSSSLFLKKYYKLVGKLYNSFITPGLEMSKRDFDSIFPIEKINSVPFGINPIINKKIKIEYNVNFFNILYMSNFISSKGIFDILKSIKYVTQKYKNVRFIFAGEWISDEDEWAANKIILEDKIHDYIEFVGIITKQKKKEILLKSHIFLLPTYYKFEGLPLSLLDAMSCGHFIITTDHAAIGEVIKYGVNGLFCKQRNPIDLSNKILLAIEHKDLTYKVRNFNVNEFYELYTYDKYIKRLTSVLNKYIYLNA